MKAEIELADAPATVGETFAKTVRFSDDEIRAFARTVDDRNPLHHDLAAAKAQGYRGLIASGTQLGSVFMALTATHFARPGPNRRPRSGVGMGFDIRFRAPVYAGDDIDLRWSVVGIERKDRLDGWITRLEGECRAGETLLMSGTGTLLLRRPRGEGWPAP
jgi:acyl dehydratase